MSGRHIRRLPPHVEIKKWTCLNCENKRVFRRLSSFEEHNRSQHSDHTLVCKVCRNVFPNRTLLDIHKNQLGIVEKDPSDSDEDSNGGIAESGCQCAGGYGDYEYASGDDGDEPEVVAVEPEEGAALENVAVVDAHVVPEVLLEEVAAENVAVVDAYVVPEVLLEEVAAVNAAVLDPDVVPDVLLEDVSACRGCGAYGGRGACACGGGSSSF